MNTQIDRRRQAIHIGVAVTFLVLAATGIRDSSAQVVPMKWTTAGSIANGSASYPLERNVSGRPTTSISERGPAATAASGSPLLP